MDRTYLSIDLKSFYASVECLERGLDPMTTNLVVADASRTEKTICLAVSPSLKAYGVSGRARLFEVVQRVKEVNARRRMEAPGRALAGSSWKDPEVRSNPALALDYLVAPPRMAHYIQKSTQVYQVYLKYAAAQDIHIYSIDEVFIDATHYLKTYGLTGPELAKTIILDVLATTGITATAGVGPNLYLSKVAMDIWAKRVRPDADGVRIAVLDEMSYRENLWSHRPLTDFWRVGRGYAKKLESQGLYTMGDIARCSVGRATDYYNEELLYRMFGVNAELLIDHAWGWEPCTIAAIKAYRPETNSIDSGQVLPCPYDCAKTRLAVWEMADRMALGLVEKGLVSNQLTLTVGYDIENLKDPERRKRYKGEIVTDRYGRQIPKHAHGTANLESYTASSKKLTQAAIALFDRIIDPELLTRRLNLTANRVIPEADIPQEAPEQLDLFTDYAEKERQKAEEQAALEKEKRLQKAMVGIQKKYGKNALLKGANLMEGATTVDRNSKIGGHQA